MPRRRPVRAHGDTRVAPPNEAEALDLTEVPVPPESPAVRLAAQRITPRRPDELQAGAATRVAPTSRVSARLDR